MTEIAGRLRCLPPRRSSSIRKPCKRLLTASGEEAHLHPPLLSAFVRALSDLLINRNGVGIIATHSPVVLQEVPRSCVWKVRRTNVRVEAERPEIETFGENVGILTRESASGRAIYDDIFAAAKGRCPLCGHRAVTTLDHHLPKAYYPVLAVTPLNLVPSCSDCNKAKLARIPHAPEDVSIHPYFDDVDDERWLFAEVVHVAPASVRFRVEPPPEWDAVLAERVRRHFRGLNLSALYGSEAAEELLNIRHLLSGLHANGGADDVRAHLEEHAQSCIAGASTVGEGRRMRLGLKVTGLAMVLSLKLARGCAFAQHGVSR